MSTLGMPEGDKRVLNYIARVGPADAYGIAKSENLNLSTVQNAIKRLRKKNLINLVGKQLSEKMQEKHLFGLTLPGFAIALSVFGREYVLASQDGIKVTSRDFDIALIEMLTKNGGLHWIFAEISKIYQDGAFTDLFLGGWSNIVLALSNGLSMIDPRKRLDDLPIDFLLSGRSALLMAGYLDLVFEAEFFGYIVSQWRRRWNGETHKESEANFTESLEILMKSDKTREVLFEYLESEIEAVNRGQNLLYKYLKR